MNPRKISLLSSFFLLSLVLSCRAPQKTTNSNLMGSEDSACQGLDTDYLKNGILGPDKDSSDLIKTKMDEETYKTRYSYNEVKGRASCEISKLITGAIKDTRSQLTNMALGFAKKAALQWLDGFTMGLASGILGGNSGSGGGVSTSEIKAALTEVINQAFEQERAIQFEGKMNSFMQKYQNLLTLSAQRPDFGHQALMVNELELALSKKSEDLYQRRLSAMITLRDDAIDLLNDAGTKELDGVPNFKVAKAFQLILGIYVAIDRDLRVAGIPGSLSVIRDHVNTLLKMENLLQVHVNSNVSIPHCTPIGENKTVWCAYRKFGAQIDRYFSAECRSEKCEKPSQEKMRTFLGEVNRMRLEDVDIEYNIRFKDYFGETYDEYIIQMSKILGEPIAPRWFCNDPQKCSNNGNVRIFNGSTFSESIRVTRDPYFGSKATGLADINGDGYADFYVVNDSGSAVRYNRMDLTFGTTQTLTNDAFFGSRATGFARIDGDAFADFFVVNDDGAYVRYNLGNGTFGPTVRLSNDAFYGTKATGFADINGDGRSDFYVVNDDLSAVRLNLGNGAFSENIIMTNDPYFGTRATGFADFDGDAKADFFVVNDNGMYVRMNRGNNTFGDTRQITSDSYYGSYVTTFGDMNGDKMSDFFVVN